MIDAPDPWEHEAGYRLLGHGQFIKYSHPHSGRVARIEVDGTGYRVYLMDSSLVAEEHGEFDQKHKAIDYLEGLMTMHA